jgi:predicted ABC-type ATPase
MLQKKKGYAITLFFLYLNSIELAKQRVSLRVSKGGHNIAGKVIERRYIKGLENLSLYKKAVNNWYMYDNSDGIYEMIAKNINGKNEIINFDLYKLIDGICTN